MLGRLLNSAYGQRPTDSRPPSNLGPNAEGNIAIIELEVMRNKLEGDSQLLPGMADL